MAELKLLVAVYYGYLFTEARPFPPPGSAAPALFRRAPHTTAVQKLAATQR